ncbi:hypothetical protein QEN19_000825 [Hanseniaspora menglaensis]
MHRSESTNFNSLSPELIHSFKQLFKFIDIDNDNNINKEDIKKLIKVMNLSESIDLKTMFIEDSDSITYPEFLTILGNVFQGFPGYNDLRDALLAFCQEDKKESLNKIDTDDLFHYLLKSGFYISKKEDFLSQWKHYIDVEHGISYFKGSEFLENFQ